MFVTNKGALKKATFPEIENSIFDEKGNIIFRGDGKGIDYSKVKPIGLKP